MECEARRRGAHRSGRLPESLGHWLSPAEHLLPAQVDTDARWQTDCAAGRSIPPRQHEESRRVVMAKESISPHAAASGPVRLPGDGQQLGCEVTAECAL